MLMDLRLFRRLLPLVLLLVTTPLPAHVEPSGDAAIELEECRFLSIWLLHLTNFPAQQIHG